MVQGEQTPADVVAEALSRTWVDRPAVAVRAELRSGPADGDEHGRRLDGAELRRLMERAAEIKRDLAIARAQPDQLRRHLADLGAKRADLVSAIDQHGAQLAEARRILGEHDHPLVWRLHRTDVEGARHGMKWLPDVIERDGVRLMRTEAQISLATGRLEEAVRLANSTSDFVAELAEVRHQLDGDVRARGAQAVVEPAVVDALGPRPASGAAEAMWCDAAGHISQHRAAFDGTGAQPAGQAQRLIQDDAYATSQRARQAAVERLDRTLGRVPEIEPPHRSLGLSL